MVLWGILIDGLVRIVILIIDPFKMDLSVTNKVERQ